MVVECTAVPSLTKAPSHTKAPGARKLRPCSLIGWLISALPGEGGLRRAPLGPLQAALPQGSGLSFPPGPAAWGWRVPKQHRTADSQGGALALLNHPRWANWHSPGRGGLGTRPAGPPANRFATGKRIKHHERSRGVSSRVGCSIVNVRVFFIGHSYGWWNAALGTSPCPCWVYRSYSKEAR